jgi:predicted nuclease of predicted toxin-antitoxin system
MNLTPQWVPYLVGAGIDAVHWATVGAGGAPDSVLMAWAESEGRVLFTNDLDLGTLLATAGAQGPSVVQVRALDLAPGVIGEDVLRLLHDHAPALQAGAIVPLDATRTRVRIFPITRRGATSE